jgi:type IV fimbrial biogenesis protein FimT
MRRLKPCGITGGSLQAGLTLVELLIGLTIAGMLAVTAAPDFADFITNSRLRESGNALLAEALFAQSEAIKRNRTLRLVTSNSQITVIDPSNASNPLRQRQLPAGVSAGSTSLDFGSEGRPATFGNTGTFNITLTSGSCSSDLRCPGLRVDAGGAIRLCSNHLSGCV